MESSKQKKDNTDNISKEKEETPKKYLCTCIDCIGEWEGIYKNIDDLKKDMLLYCRSGSATYTIIE